jgi:hypothetical protein
MCWETSSLRDISASVSYNKWTALLTRNRDNRPSVADLAYKCRRRIDRQEPTFACQGLQVTSEAVCALRALVRGFVAPFSKFAIDVRAETGRMMNLQRGLCRSLMTKRRRSRDGGDTGVSGTRRGLGPISLMFRVLNSQSAA